MDRRRHITTNQSRLPATKRSGGSTSVQVSQQSSAQPSTATRMKTIRLCKENELLMKENESLKKVVDKLERIKARAEAKLAKEIESYEEALKNNGKLNIGVSQYKFKDNKAMQNVKNNH
ncbi:hypothetical protein ABG067_003193 [Albugo candida]